MNPGAAIALGIGVGAAIGVAIDNLTAGVGVGAAIGAAIALASIRSNRPPGSDDDKDG